MRTSRLAVLLTVAGLTGAANAAAQTPPPPPPPAPAPAPAAPAATPAPAPATTTPGTPAPGATPDAPPAAPAQGPGGTTAPPAAPGTPPPATPAAPAPPWWSTLSGDAFVDAYGAVDYNFPRPQFGNTTVREYDTAQGFSLNWLGLDGTYAADPIGGTISLRFGPGATLHNTSVALGTPSSQSDDAIGMQYVRQAYATVKFGGSFTLDAGKYDQPFGSEVPDSQLNMEYTRSLLFTLNQPLFFTGLRLDYAPTSMIDFKLIAANGWNNSFDNNRGKTFGAQFSIKPIDQVQFYIGYAGGPEATDYGMNAGSNADWRHLVDAVVDINPSSNFRILINGDYDTQSGLGGHSAVWYGANLALKYVPADPFSIVLRGEIVSDKHGDIVAPATGSGKDSSTLESGTLTLSYVIASHYTLMLDTRVDAANSNIFATVHQAQGSTTQVTSTLGVIASTH